MTVTLPKEVWDDLLRSLEGPAGDLISPGTIHNFKHGYHEAKMTTREAEDTLCPFCKLALMECACEDPPEQLEDVLCHDCGRNLNDCDCDVRILEEEA